MVPCLAQESSGIVKTVEHAPAEVITHSASRAERNHLEIKSCKDVLLLSARVKHYAASIGIF